MEQAVDIIIRARDEASRTFDKIQKRMGRFTTPEMAAAYIKELGLGQQFRDTGEAAEIAGGSVRGFFSTFVGRGTAVTIVAFAIARFADQITEAHKAFRQSNQSREEWARGIMSSIPIVGHAATAIYKMNDEINGVPAAIETAEKATKNLDVLMGLKYRIKTFGTTSEEKARLNIEKAYSDIFRSSMRDLEKGVITMEEYKTRMRLVREEKSKGLKQVEISITEAKGLKYIEEVRVRKLAQMGKEKKKQEELNQALKKHADMVKSFAESALQAIKSPYDLIRDEIVKVEEAIGHGVLSGPAGLKYLQQFQKETLTPKGTGGRGGLAAEEGRFLTFAPGTRFNATEKNTSDTAKNTNRTTKILERIEKALLRNSRPGDIGLTELELSDFN